LGSEKWPVIGYTRRGLPIYPIAGGDGTEDGDGNPPAADPPKPDKTFTQAELDAIVTDRLKREGQKYSDYETLKAQAAKVQEFEEAQKTELQKANEARESADKRALEADARANTALKRGSILAAAAVQGSADPEMVVSLLINSGDITVDKDGNVTGAEDVVKSLLEAKPFLKGVPSRSGGEFGGQPHSSLAEEIDKAEKKGDVKAAIQLKVQKALSQG
jgi:hypothetical protein